MPTCDHCNSHVSSRFYTVFAAGDGDLHACPNCSATAGIAEVAQRRAGERR
jgi:predicted  nucleic acid-binding Zn-ribbon protein